MRQSTSALVQGLYDTVREASDVYLAEQDAGICWSCDRQHIYYNIGSLCHMYDGERILAQMIREIQICAEHGWPWAHALAEPWLCHIEGTEFVGAQGGLTYRPDTGEWE